jgi:hypothetical protein
MSRALVWLKPHETNLSTIFDDYLTEAVGLPIADWN